METILVPGGGYASNCYMIFDRLSGEGAVIDPSSDYDAVMSAAGRVDVAVTKILLTHGHFDHILNLRPLRETTGAPVYVHADDAACLTDARRSEFLSFLGKNITFSPAEMLLHDGDEIPIGSETVTVLHTPGHTPGSVVYAFGTTLLTGDTLFAGCIGRTDLLGGDSNAMNCSIRRLLKLPDDTVIYPGHGGKSTIEHEKSSNPFLRGVI